ncbi:MAG: peptidoglycan recognition family protein [Synechococcaceae cyanobacterium]|nr:peptidoglycan recognition family protein [Synechococcaceae cyanobacterium]
MHRSIQAASLLLSLALTGCGGRQQRGWPVRDLPDAGLPRLGEVALARCAARLGLAAELPRPADPTNFGERRRVDADGRAVPHEPRLIVLHETVMDAPATIALFQTPHPRDEDQVSYHLLVDRAGQRLRIVPDRGRAYGAGASAFGDMTVRYSARSPGSINEVALHLSLESPPDGRGDAPAHSGYSPAQYRAVAGQVLLWQLRWGIPLSRLTTHAAVDRSHSRYDPRSFRWNRFDAAYLEAARRCAQDPEALARLRS